MRLPRQAAPVQRGWNRVKKVPTLIGPSSCWGSCMVSQLQSQLDVTGLQNCASVSSVTSFVSCVVAILGTLDAPVIAALAAVDAVACGLDCVF